MRLKKLHIAGSLLVAGITITTLSSSSSGNPSSIGRSTSGCGGAGCHGAQSGATVIALSGIPSTGWLPNVTYSLMLTVTNATKTKAGFDLSVNTGTLTAGSGTQLNGTTEILHNVPQVLSSGAATWSFSWKAPASRSTPLTVKIAGNAVNGDGAANAADNWNTQTDIYDAAANTSISNTLAEGGFSIFPNPAKDFLTLTAKAGTDIHATAVSVDGRSVALTAEKTGADHYQLTLGQLPAGLYMLVLNAAGKNYTSQFVKL